MSGMTERRRRCTLPPMRHLLLTTFLLLACGRTPDLDIPGFEDDGSGGSDGPGATSSFEASASGSTTGSGHDESSGGSSGCAVHEESSESTSEGSTGEPECGTDPDYPKDECYIDAAGFCWCGPD